MVASLGTRRYAPLAFYKYGTKLNILQTYNISKTITVDNVTERAWAHPVSCEFYVCKFYYNCTAVDCPVTDDSLKDGYAAHDFSNGNCVCGKPASMAFVLNDDNESYSVKAGNGIGDCLWLRL